MKKMIMILAFALGLSANAFSQCYSFRDKDYGGGLFCRGLMSDEVYYGAFVDKYGLFNNYDLPGLPGHDLGGDQPAPVGSGALLMLAFGAAYAFAKKRKED